MVKRTVNISTDSHDRSRRPRQSEELQQQQQSYSVQHPRQRHGILNPPESEALQAPQQPQALQLPQQPQVIQPPQQPFGLQDPQQPDKLEHPHQLQQLDELHGDPQPGLHSHAQQPVVYQYAQHPYTDQHSQQPWTEQHHQQQWTARPSQQPWPEQPPPSYDDAIKQQSSATPCEWPVYTAQRGMDNWGFLPAHQNLSIQPITAQSAIATYPYWQTVPQVQQESPRDYMGVAICATICCCWCIGICAIQSATDARRAIATGDMVRARAASRKAKQLIIMSIVTGTFITAIIVIIITTLY